MSWLGERHLPPAVFSDVIDDRNYLLMRAEEEEAKASGSSDEAVKRAHLGLAVVYRRTALSFCPRWLPVDQATHPKANFPEPVSPPTPD